MTDYYDPTGEPTQDSDADSVDIRDEFTAIQTGISNKLPPLTGNGGKYIRVNAGATAAEATTGIDILSGSDYKIDGTTKLNATSLGSTVTASSLTSVGTLQGLDVGGDITADSSFVLTNTSSTTGIIFDINASALTTGKAARFLSSATNTSTRAVVEIDNSASAAVNTVLLELDQGAANAFIDFVGAHSGNTTDPISTHNTSGATTDHLKFKLNGTDAWIAVSTNAPTA